MAGIRDSFVDSENHRLQLEQSVAKLRSSLHHWQAWEIEYEGMREDILGLGPDHTQAELVRILLDRVENEDTDTINRKTSARLLTKLGCLQAKALS